MRIELTYPAWKAGVLPLNYTRVISDTSSILSYLPDKCKLFLEKILCNVTVQPSDVRGRIYACIRIRRLTIRCAERRFMSKEAAKPQ